MGLALRELSKRCRGVVTRAASPWHYGQLLADCGCVLFFLHANVVWADRWEPKVGQRVLFTRRLVARGLQADAVRPTNGKLWPKSAALRRAALSRGSA